MIDMANERKLYVVKFSINEIGKYFSILKAFPSKMLSQQYVERKCKELLKERFNPKCAHWENDLTYYYENDIEKMSYIYGIEPVDPDESIELPPLPEVEKENRSLKEENNELRKQLAHTKGLNSAAQCYLTMWDGGWDYAKEHVIENMHKAKSVLSDGEKGNELILNMFEGWLEGRCKTCQKKEN
jgi:hypothetical protein